MAIPCKPSPLGPRSTPSSRPRATTSPTDPTLARIRQKQRAKSAELYQHRPWLKHVSMRTRQMNKVRRKFRKIDSGFYWLALCDKVMGEKNRAANKYFLGKPSANAAAAVTTTDGPAVAEEKSMDFSRMEERWNRGAYILDAGALRGDFDLMVDNAIAKYPKGHSAHAAAEKLRQIYEEACERRRWSKWVNNAVRIAHEAGLEL